MIELHLRGGRVIDPAANLDVVGDVVIRDGRIAGVVEPGSIAPAPGADVRDVTGSIVIPGLVDLHGHFYDASPFGIDPVANLRGAVTTGVDAGSAGYANFFSFRRYVIDRAPVRILAFVHVAAAGLATTILPELGDVRYARPIEAAEVAAANRDVVVGIKVRTGAASGSNSRETLGAALEAGERSGMRVMAHIQDGAPVGWVLSQLRPGDILTHAFTAGAGGLFGERDGVLGDRLLPEAVDARRRGVHIDIGHGCGSFSWQAAHQAIEQGFPPDSISTDIHRYSIDGPVHDLPTTMSKFLHLGMTLPRVVAAATEAPARAIGRDGELGSLAVGRRADVSVLRVEEGAFAFVDAFGAVETAERRLRPALVVVDGRVVDPLAVDVPLRPFVASDADIDCGAPIALDG